MLLKEILEDVHEVCRATFDDSPPKDIIERLHQSALARLGHTHLITSVTAGNSPSELFPYKMPDVSLFLSRLRGRAVRQASHDSLSRGTFCLAIDARPPSGFALPSSRAAFALAEALPQRRHRDVRASQIHVDRRSLMEQVEDRKIQ